MRSVGTGPCFVSITSRGKRDICRCGEFIQLVVIANELVILGKRQRAGSVITNYLITRARNKCIKTIFLTLHLTIMGRLHSEKRATRFAQTIGPH